MKQQAKGPKFRAGQVVGVADCISKQIFSFPDYVKISRISHGKEGFSYFLNREVPWLCEDLLRALTVREAGPARGRKRQ